MNTGALKLTMFLLAALLVGGCSSDSDPDYQAAREGDDPPTLGEPRELDVTGDNVSVLDIESYYSLYRYGPTLKIYHLKDQNVVLKISIDNTSTDFEMDVTVAMFADDLPDEDLEKWINNQHSDGIYPDAPEPLATFDLPEQSHSVTSHTLIDQSAGQNGDEYDNYALELYVDNVSEEDVFYLMSFVADAVVHVQTRDIDQ